jgi:hypothetical protein
MVCVSIGVVILAMTAGSLGRSSDTVSSIPSIERTPLSAIETGFAALRASSIDNTVTGLSQTQDHCIDFHYAFLNSRCAKAHVKRAALNHRVATPVVGGTDKSPVVGRS